ncbi:extracellular solute-binding protein [Cryobacterium sp. CG_9.6]|uniref:ABC transporter substrate-binding protein n=1 Tax=Cryobacterium sp. CG_9.6 TaxID=2760710 RepID=UPI002475DCAC|nr:extracellular solute-binding protein [Cryobacterium sp. CG_9.6]MDH6237642.1 multiple sugar transport system substrate-binding protein [Cryobacterium sp. CG_9.6]
MRITKRAATVALLTAATVALSGCSTAASTSDTAADCAPADGKVNLTFTSWIPGIEDVVDVWNEANPDIQVAVQTGPNGNGGTYANFFNQLEAGNAPDLGQIEYDALPNFRVQDGLVNLASCAGVLDAQADFVDWTWGQVNFNEEDAVYAIPQDSGPMAMFYRADLFEANNIAIPTTWAEFATAAEQVRATGNYITNFSQSDINQFAGLVWQAGGTWFGNDGTDWSVNLTDDTSIKVADYWQDLIDRDLVSTQPPWTTEWDNAYNTGAAWTWNSAAWGANSIASGAPDTAGKWAVAPSPQWAAGDAASGNWGGSSTAVFTGSEHPYEAAQFALWLNSSSESLTMLNESANLYPAAKAGLDLPVLKEGVAFYGDQPIYDVFAAASSEVSADFVWGPTMTQTYNDVSDGFKAAVSGNGTLAEALTTGQTATIEALKAQSIPVKE